MMTSFNTSSKSLSKLRAHKLFELIISNSFKCSKEFEDIQVLKGTWQDLTYIVTSLSKERSKILQSSFAVKGELISPTPTNKKLTATKIAKKKYHVIIAKNLNKGLTPWQVECGLGILIGEKNIVSIYIPRVEDKIHTSIANIEFLNVPIYKKFVKKTHKLQSKYAKFNLHPRSLDGSVASLEEIRKELEFHDINTTLASPIEALENATAAPKKKRVAKVDITSLLKEAIGEGNQSLKRELKVDIKPWKKTFLQIPISTLISWHKTWDQR